MELQVTLTLSDRLFALLEDKLPNLGRRIEKAVTKEIGASTRRESSIEVSVSAKTPETAAPMVAAEEVPETPQPAVAPKPAVASSAQQDGKSHGEMIREIMHRTRQRFEGEDYKENTESEAYKKYHRALTNQFKQIAVTLGYEKPSCIDAPEKIEAFAAECDALIIDEKGFIAPPPAPY